MDDEEWLVYRRGGPVYHKSLQALGMAVRHYYSA